MAEYWHRRIRAEMGLLPDQGKFGGGPGLADQSGVWAILHRSASASP
jgi:hypothetical protein